MITKKGVITVITIIAVTFSAYSQKFGHVDSQKLLVEMPEYKWAEEALQKYADHLRAEIENQQNELQSKLKEFEEAKAAGSFNPETEQSRFNELQEISLKLQEYQQVSAPQLLQDKEAILMEPLVQRVKDAIYKVGTANNYTYIYDSNTLLFSAGGIDLGPLVIEVLKSSQ